ncbi:MAG: C-type lectin domain-containing protein [Proteobacteria bacterium]|nr:C-type lectin domain-containing protein [Pseudomonadota bacterium]
MRWLPAALLVACYSARPQAGITCDPTAPACPSGQACLASDGAFACLPPDTVTGDAASDGDALAIDAPSIDASIDAPTCTATGLSCNQPGGQALVSTCNGGCWVACREKLSRPSAAARCAAWGGVLAPVEDVVLDTACVATISSDTLWFGAIQAPDQLTLMAGWSWNATTPIASTNWTFGEPNDLDGIEDNEENCATLNSGGSGTWADRPCSNTHAFVCRR